MSCSRIFGFDPVESILAAGLGTLAEALEFAAMRAESVALSDGVSPESTVPTQPAPVEGER